MNTKNHTSNSLIRNKEFSSFFLFQDKSNINIGSNASRWWKKLQSKHNDLEIYINPIHEIEKNYMAESLNKEPH